jgi:hypothetical protein
MTFVGQTQPAPRTLFVLDEPDSGSHGIGYEGVVLDVTVEGVRIHVTKVYDEDSIEGDYARSDEVGTVRFLSNGSNFKVAEWSFTDRVVLLPVAA